ncbi:helix-turn-helix domain-containing protein [Streptacidiphilus sp. N1-12]|uniref:Helix-turn-helix domain-containing protein n=2 Tax=Streptacidiphilus alkalitolerans TaxID=3342712 RepID=A0ABV6WEY8_9ACTN
MTGRQLAARNVSIAVGQNIAAWRRWHGLSGSTLSASMAARGLPMSPANLSNIENGHQRVTVDQLVAFAQVLGLTPEQLLKGPACRSCWDTPPPKFTCQVCKAEG